MKLAEHTWTDAAAADDAVALLPVGSTEQHGPHAPLGTDSLLAEAVAERGAAAAEGQTIVAPTLSVGVAEEHRRFAGTLWLQPSTFRTVVRETVASLAHHGWTRVVVVNGHGGNTDALREVCAHLTRDEVAYVVPFTWFEAVDVPKSEMGHGGAIETSGVLAVRPDLVHPDRYDEAIEGAADGWGHWLHGVNMAYDSDEFTESGVVGDPSTADAERGEALLEEAAAALADLVEAVVARD